MDTPRDAEVIRAGGMRREVEPGKESAEAPLVRRAVRAKGSGDSRSWTPAKVACPVLKRRRGHNSKRQDRDLRLAQMRQVR